MRKFLTEEDLFKLLASFHPLSDELRKDLKRLLRYEEFKCGKCLLKAGSVCDRIYFITQGLIHCYHGTKENPDTDFFMTEGEIATSKISFYDQVQSVLTIEAMEDVTVLSLSYTDLEWLYQKYVEFNINGRKLTEIYHKRNDFKSDILRLRGPVDRFNFMKERRPELIERVPGKPLASFMGIARETLSRIMSQEKKKSKQKNRHPQAKM